MKVSPEKGMTKGAEIRVRYAETDQMGVVHHANYLVWFEAARTEFLRGSGYSYAEFEREGIFLPVVAASCHYLSPAFYDDTLTINCKTAQLTPARLELRYQVLRGQDVLAYGTTLHAFLDEDRRPVNLKKRSPRLWEILTGLSE